MKQNITLTHNADSLNLAGITTSANGGFSLFIPAVPTESAEGFGRVDLRNPVLEIDPDSGVPENMRHYNRVSVKCTRFWLVSVK